MKLYFLMLPDPEFAIRRVERRVQFGGHDIPEATIRRRFQRDLENQRNHYVKVVDEWSIYDGSESSPLLQDADDNRPPDKLSLVSAVQAWQGGVGPTPFCPPLVRPLGFHNGLPPQSKFLAILHQ